MRAFVSLFPLLRGLLRYLIYLQSEVKAVLEGQIVMTYYNKKTYRIDEVTFDVNPLSTFHLRKEDRDISYVEYYKKHYDITIKNEKTPMLISRPSRRDVNRGDCLPIYLVPELCAMTGLTDDMRLENFYIVLITWI